MTDYGASDTSTTSLGANQFPISEVYVPNDALRALEGGAVSTDGGGKKSAPASVYVKDGGNVAQGTTTDAAYTSGAGTIIALLKKLVAELAATLTVAGTITEANSAALLTDTAAIQASVANIPAKGQALAAASSPVVLTAIQQAALTPPAAIAGFALEAGHLATIDTSASASKTDLDNLNTALGAITDAAWSGAGSASSIAILKKIEAVLAATLAVSGSVSVSNFPGTQPVSGTVTANAGTSLNTSLLALEAGGNLATIAAALAGTLTTSPLIAGKGHIFKPIKSVAITNGTPVAVWTPTAGKRFRLLGYYISISVDADILFEDATGSGNEFLRIPRSITTNFSPIPVTLAPLGYLSTAVNNALFLDVTSTATVYGYVFGNEE